MKKFVSVLLSALVAGMALAGCSSAASSQSSSSELAQGSSVVEAASSSAQGGGFSGPVTIKHQLGEIVIEAVPEKVAVFDFGTLDTIDALGVTAEIALPKSNIPSYLSKFADEKYTDAGNIKEPNLEAIHAFAPDLIVISARQADFYEELSAIAPTLFIEIDSSRYMDDFKQNAGWIGQVFGMSEQVDKQIATIEEKIETIKSNVNQEEKALIILTNDGSISAYGSGSRFGIIHDVFGVPTADSAVEVSTHGQEVNYEYIAQINPDILYVVDRTAVVGGEKNAAATLDNDLVNGTNAVKNGRVYELNPDVWYLSVGGLQSVSMMADDVAASLGK